LLDPERYLIAFFDAFVVVNNRPERESARILAGMLFGNEVSPPAELVERCPSGYVPMSWGPARPKTYGTINNTRMGVKAGTIEGRADAIRKKARISWGDPTTDHWRLEMAKAFALAISPIRDVQGVKYAVMALTGAVGETDYATRVILPMIDIATGDNAAAPDLAHIFGPTT